MTIGKKERVRVRISKGTKIDLKEELKEIEKVQIEEIKVGIFMKVRLEGDNFDIKALSHAEQIVFEEEIT